MSRTRRTHTPMSARDLKNSTGEVVRTLRRGGSILLTFRGKPLGTIEPLRPDDPDIPVVEPFEEGWARVEAELKRSQPRFASWREAEDASRGRG
jgi:antitoxin (DNA-binding transcriptional repressor) of toxin-antitoxin stability system